MGVLHIVLKKRLDLMKMLGEGTRIDMPSVWLLALEALHLVAPGTSLYSGTEASSFTQGGNMTWSWGHRLVEK